MEQPSVPMTHQLIKRTRGKLSEEQRIESKLLRKAAKLHKQGLPDGQKVDEEQVAFLYINVEWGGAPLRDRAPWNIPKENDY